MNKICRACLATKEVFTYFLCENVSAEIYWYCTSVEVYKEDGLPKSICKGCYGVLTKFIEFKKTSIRSQDTLLNIKNGANSKTTGFNDSVESMINNPINNEEQKLSLNVLVKTEDLDLVEDTQDNYYENAEVETNDKKMQKRSKKLDKVKSSVKIHGKHFMYQCNFCNKKFKYIQRLNAHKLEHEAKEVSIQCQTCNKTFMTWSGLKRHNDTEHTIVSLESLKCSTCGRICKSRQTLAMHMKIHGERKLFMCDTCGKTFTTRFILRTHLETHKENRERRFTCEHCGKKFFTNTILTSHVSRRHTGRRFICQICNYPFTTKYNLAKHLLLHDGKKMYKCDICDKAFATHSSLVEHKRIHSGEKPFSCCYCPKSFISKRRLNDHHRMHTGDKPHKCDRCDQRFTQRGTLKRHMKVHDRLVPMIT